MQIEGERAESELVCPGEVITTEPSFMRRANQRAGDVQIGRCDLRCTDRVCVKGEQASDSAAAEGEVFR